MTINGRISSNRDRHVSLETLVTNISISPCRRMGPSLSVFSRPYYRAYATVLRPSVVCLSVTYLLWLHGGSYRKTSEEANRKWAVWNRMVT